MSRSSSGERKRAERIKKNREGSGKRNRKEPKKLDFVQDFIPIRDIRCGIVETVDGRYVKILEIEPINFLLRSDEEQFNIIAFFANWLKISPVRLQFKSVTRKADSDKRNRRKNSRIRGYCLPRFSALVTAATSDSKLVNAGIKFFLSPKRKSWLAKLFVFFSVI